MRAACGSAGGAGLILNQETFVTRYRGGAIYYAYNGLLLLLSPLLAVSIALRLVRGKSRVGWSERWGRVSVPQRAGRRVWAHAASVGEVMAATPILQAYRDRRPDDDIVLSVITPGGHEVGCGLKGKLLSAVFYAPFDVPFAVNRTVNAVRPDVFVCLETELWPNLLACTRRSGARLALVNARISDRSAGRYRTLRLLFRWVLSQFDRLLAQTETDARRLLEIGAPPDRVAVCGNSKFDQAADRLTAGEVASLRADFRLRPEAPVLVVGSTRVAEEERMLLEAYRLAREEIPDLALIHAPRHVDRAGEVVQIIRDSGYSAQLRSRLAGFDGQAEQVVLDTFGELGRVYALGSVAFIGNSLVPPGGGQNPLQPFAQGKPVIYGPWMQNFRDIAAMAESAGVAFRAASAGEVAQRIVSIVKDATGADSMEERAVTLVASNRGAAGRYAQALAELMDEAHARQPGSTR